MTINGSNFLTGLVLTVDGSPTAVSSFTATTVTFQMPPGHNCDTLIEVTNIGSVTASQVMNATPVIAHWAPTSGPAAGGTPFTFVGGNFAGATVTFNGMPAVNLSGGATILTGMTPPGAVGPAVVAISNPNGCQATRTFTYR